MSHHSSLARFRPSVTAILVGLTAAVLASCSTDLQSSNPSSSDALPSLEAEGDTTSEANPEALADATENVDAGSLPTASAEEPTGEADPEAIATEPVETDAIASGTQVEAIPPEANPPEPEAEPAEENVDTTLSDSVSDTSSETGSELDADEDATSAERSEHDESANSLDASEGEEVFSASSESSETTSASEAPPETDTSPETGDRAWRLVQNRGRLRVGLDPTVGYTYLRANTERRTFEGFEWDILQAIAQELDIDIEPMYIPWDNQLAALDTNSVDVILGGRDALGVDETRYTPTIPYYSSPQRIVVREEFSAEIQHLSDLFGRKVGTVADSAGAAVVEVFNQERANALTLLSSPNPSQLFEQLRESQVDAIVIDQPVAVAEADIVEAIALEEDGTSGDGDRSEADGEAGTNSPSRSGDTATALDADIGLDVIEPLAVEPAVSSPSQPEEPMNGESSSEKSAQESGETTAERVGEGTTPNVSLHIVGEPMFPTPLVGVVKTEEASIKQAIDEAIVTLEQNGTLTTILEKWDL